ncbi:pentatricopeptide repeat-containing protein At2g01510, mitochondrial-like [Macadamia integrifolia]|uniref:pentatricopeptide repeat-containing protein At2g01510, mitochondrial-like n=1 Tax=Macadamia integrifolia TaxID=60698 RepID=UPI001C4E6CC5|nr:pentatricopeptide repeat-containing protein At2g01510, mitochondrial-like [Macadamia integrifolia]
MLPKVKIPTTAVSFYSALHLKLFPSILHCSSFHHTHKHGTSTPSSPSSPFTKQAFTSLLQSSSSQSHQLKQIHALLLTSGLSIKNSLITQLLSSLTLLGDMTYARLLFDEMHKPRSFLWNTLIKGYVKNDLSIEATSVYQIMRGVGVRPDPFTFPFVLKACSQVDDLCAGQEVHAHVIKFGLDFDAIVRTELMLMYAKVGELCSADYLFETMSERDLVAWNALISVYVQTGNAGKALGMFHGMVLAGIKPDSVTVVSALSACANLGCLETGKQIDQFVIKENLNSNLFVNNARLDMYAKCGSIETARCLFDKMPQRNVISWSTMIGGYAMNGDSDKSLHLFSLMQNAGVQPNHVTYLGVLSACGHVGLVREGQSYFKEMIKSNDCNVQPRLEHYACMVDLLGRSGHLDEAYNFIKSMPIEPDVGVWGALLGSCTIHKNIKLGQHVSDILFNLSPEISSYHVLLSNIYAAAGRWVDVENVRRKMRKKGVKKVVAYSAVEANGEVHVFHGGDRTHPLSSNIYEVLAELIKQITSIGYVPNITEALHDVQMEEKEATLSTHSEKLAIAFGLINVRPPFPIRIMKNLRICNDCHTFVKLTSKVTNREIIMRDKNRFHYFKDGSCSCKDFW